MNIITTVSEMQSARAAMSGAVALVPTMGALHEGHLSLVSRARTDNEHVVVSIFVNPTQFNESADFEHYPRNTERDLHLLEAEGADIVFMPSADEIYPLGFDDWVEVTGPLTEHLEGAARPGHFRGVTTVVARLFRIIRPHRAYFGQKDAQQLRVIRRMVKNLEMNVEIVPMPIIRDPGGLALSSRNVHLSPDERRAAFALSRALTLARRLVMQDGVTNADTVHEAIGALFSTPPLHLEYVSVADEQTLEELQTIDRPALILLAARIGATRLIDNNIVIPKGMPIPAQLAALMQPPPPRSS